MVAAGVPGGRRIVASVLQRADEPGEALAYWTSTYGRAIPKPVKRGIADAVGRLYTEYGLLKYDTAAKGFRFADVIDLVHPAPAAPWQGDLFRTRSTGGTAGTRSCRTSLPMLAANAELRAAPRSTTRRCSLDADRLRAAGMTWEDVLSLAGDRVDKAALWTGADPGHGLHGAAAEPAQLRPGRRVRRGRRAGGGAARRPGAGGAVAAAADAVPVGLPGGAVAAVGVPAGAGDSALARQQSRRCRAARWCCVDTSGSMHSGSRKDGTLMRWDAAVMFGVALAQRCASADVVSFSSGTKVFPVSAG